MKGRWLGAKLRFVLLGIRLVTVNVATAQRTAPCDACMLPPILFAFLIALIIYEHVCRWCDTFQNRILIQRLDECSLQIFQNVKVCIKQMLRARQQ